VTHTRCRIDTVIYPDDGHVAARNMRIEINVQSRNCATDSFYLEDYTRMHGQQNIKINKKNMLLSCLSLGGVFYVKRIDGK
jgi:hypothetical protein